jgi:hypothetical protein
MGWITMGRDHAYGGLLSGVFLQEGEGNPEEEAVQMEERKELMWTAVVDTVETSWTFLQGIGAPEGISLAGPGQDRMHHMTGWNLGLQYAGDRQRNGRNGLPNCSGRRSGVEEGRT